MSENESKINSLVFSKVYFLINLLYSCKFSKNSAI